MSSRAQKPTGILADFLEDQALHNGQGFQGIERTGIFEGKEQDHERCFRGKSKDTSVLFKM